jgi:hypothetical protein
MFDKNDGYPFIHKGYKEKADGKIYHQHTYTFKTRKNNTYIVLLNEVLDFDLYIVKFYLKNHRYSDDKYSLLTNFQEFPSILGTIINIMMETYKNNPKSSFCFQGANSKKEDIKETKRFRVYKEVMARCFSPTFFHHIEDSNKSFYLLLNKAKLDEYDTLLDDIHDFAYSNDRL